MPYISPYATLEFSTMHWPKRHLLMILNYIQAFAIHLTKMWFRSSVLKQISQGLHFYFQSAEAVPLREQSLHTGGLINAQFSCICDLYENTKSIFLFLLEGTE